MCSIARNIISLPSLRLSTQLGALFAGKKSLSFLKKRVNELWVDVEAKRKLPMYIDI